MTPPLLHVVGARPNFMKLAPVHSPLKAPGPRNRRAHRRLTPQGCPTCSLLNSACRTPANLEVARRRTQCRRRNHGEAGGLLIERRHAASSFTATSFHGRGRS